MGAEICQKVSPDIQDQITNEQETNNVNSHKCCMPVTQASEHLNTDRE